MYCQICGTEKNIELRSGRRGVLCDDCARSTPAKVSRAEFDAAYWGRNAAEVPECTKREFYSDYRASEKGLQNYIKSTTSAAM